jgi:hypothetical protein
MTREQPFQKQKWKEVVLMNEIEKVKQILGIGFAGSISTAVEYQKTVIDDLKSALGLPSDAEPAELQKKIADLQAEHEEASGPQTETKPLSRKEEKSMGFFRSLIATGERVVGWCTFLGIIIGTVWIVLYALQAKDPVTGLSIIGVAGLLSGAFFICGSLLGFLFGIPKQKALGTVRPLSPPPANIPQGEPAKSGTPQTVPPPSTTTTLETNTNLEQVSDWLTKIVVGVGLTQLNTIPGWLKEYAKAVSPNLGGFSNSPALAIGMLVYYLALGILSGYLLTRLYLTKELEEVEEHSHAA